MTSNLIVAVAIFFAFALALLWSLNLAKRLKLTRQRRTIEDQKAELSRQIEIVTKRQNEITILNKNLLTALSERNAAHFKSRDLEALINEKNKHFPWLATAFADYLELVGTKEEERLRYKARPAPVSADMVKASTKRAREAEYKFRLVKYRLDFLEKFFPWLSELTGDSLEEYLETLENRDATASSDSDAQSDDPAQNFLSPTEYQALAPAERNQTALDRWMNKGKRPNWEIGRMYERFVGYSYEQEGHKVDYFGAIEGLDDLGRDLIVRKDGVTRIVQCKYWSKDKVIHEKHVFQLFGSVVQFIANDATRGVTLPLFDTFARLSDVQPVFVTSTRLSDRASDFAKILKVEVRESIPLGTYPLIKCNVSKANGEKVYHLPFDQQYDKTRIEPEFGEFYANTVKEAEDRGFRRAYRWRPGVGD